MNRQSPAKITVPKVSGIVGRERLFKLLDKSAEKPVVWIAAPAGSGKTTLVASWLNARKLPHLWYQVDAGDNDPATFFYYLGLAARKINPRKKPLPLLTPEYLMDVPTFARRFFEELGKRSAECGMRSAELKRKRGKASLPSSSPVTPQFIIVLDNFQDAAGEQGFCDMLLHGLENIPEGVVVAALSRTGPPEQYLRLRANNRMSSIGWNELRFTLDEVRDAVKTVRRGRCLEIHCPGPETLYEKTDGWAAGLRLMIEAVEPQRNIVRNSQPGQPVCHCVESLAWRDDIFSYFSAEVLEKTKPGTRDFLLATSILPSMTVDVAARLTGRDDAPAILADLSKRHYFTDRHPGPVPVYRYHPLFREFLQARARETHEPAELLRIQRTAAGLLAEAGFFEDAVETCLLTGDFEHVSPLVLRAAWPLIAQGRIKTVERWLSCFPPSALAADPRLLHLAGISRLPFNLREARGLLEKAFDALHKKDPAAAIAVCGCVLETIIIEGSSYEAVDLWIDRLDAIVKKHHESLNGAEDQVAGIVLFALAFRNLNHRSLPLWLETAEAAVLEVTDTAQALKLCNYLMAHYLFSGDYASMTRLMKVLKPFKKGAEAVPALRLLCLLLEAYYAVYALGSVEEGIDIARRALALGRETGIAIYGFWFCYLIVASSVAAGDFAAAEECLASLRAGTQGAPPVRRGDLLVLSGAVAMGRHAWSEAAGHFQQAVDVVRRAGATYSTSFYRVQLSRALFELGQEKKARAELAAIAREKWARSGMIRYQGLLTSAYFDLREGKRKKAHAALRDAFHAAKTGGMMIAPFWNLDHTALVCAEALDAEIEPGFVGDFIRKHNLAPPAGERRPGDSWPWPVKIYALGRFEVLLNGHSLRLEGKLPKKPLEALKALIALGGRDVPEDRIMDALWPDSEGDAARASLKIALHQLRQGLGDNRFIQLKNGRLSLSPDHCWVDALAFNQAWEAVQAGKTGDPAALETCRKAMASYGGPFLPGEETRTWATAMRERLKSRFVGLVLRSAGDFMNRGLLAEAAEQYENAQDVEELDEDLCRKLMDCWARMGRKDRVARAFRRCETAFRSRLGLEPAEETRDLYTNLIAGGSSQRRR